MSEEIALACADVETVRQLRAALAVAIQENDQRIEVERALRTELEAARAVVWATKEAEFTTVGIGLSLSAYDATPKAPPMAPPPDWWWV